ncbi:MAG: adenylate/guanylate cyclase domain-containing protein [Deltaproteobacteria bacterium]|nr:adenylate/guanylate cyclase domain-containing protein [Deltaproteobacteria bacterium]
MTKRTQTGEREEINALEVSLSGFYVISMKAMAIGVAIVFVLNVATPTDFIFERFADLRATAGSSYVPVVARRLAILFLIILSIAFPSLFIMRGLLRPIRRCLVRMKSGLHVTDTNMEQARRRIINVPFIFVGIYVGMWVFFPALIFLAAYLIRFMDARTAAVFAIRASMVGFITSSVAFYRIEEYCRKGLIPLFFPEGRLAALKGGQRLVIGRRIRWFYGMGTVLPLVILLVTLVTVQLELVPGSMSAQEYGLRIILFAVVLSGIFLASAGVLNRLVVRSIVAPLKNMLQVNARIREGDYNARIQVVSNDEIGVLGDSANAMIQGLAERKTLRTAFGRYVTPEIRDEILSGRIPLEGERREGTVMFADLENFTPFVENNPPEEVMRSMRIYFTRMQQAIRSQRGLVIQFAGDEIEAVFGVPIYFETHADAAVHAALEMRKALEVLNRERKAEGKVPFAHGIGVHSGSVLAGNSGSEEQSAYCLIGNTVNVAARIEGLTRNMGCDILVSQETVKQLNVPPPMEQQPSCRVKGFSQPVTVYRLL